MTDNGRVKADDYWREDSGSINFLEAKALLCALDAFGFEIPALMFTQTAELCWGHGRARVESTLR